MKIACLQRYTTDTNKKLSLALLYYKVTSKLSIIMTSLVLPV